MPQPESIIDDLTFALSPEFAHGEPPTGNSREPAVGYTPNSMARDRRRNTAASRAGWNVSTCDSQAPGAGRSSTTFWHETGRKGSLVPIGYGKVMDGCSASSFGGGRLDQGIARRDAGVAEIARDFLVDVHGMKKRCRAVQKCYQRKCYGSVLIRLAAQLIT